MELSTIGNAPAAAPDEKLFRQGALGKWASFILAFAASAACFGAAWWAPSADPAAPVNVTLLYYLGGVGIALSLFLSTYARASLRGSNWLLRLQPDRLLIKYRSHLNDHFPKEDPVVLSLALNEVDWIRKFRHTQSSPTTEFADDVELLSHWTYLDLGLSANVDMDIIRAALATERQRPAPRVGRSRTRHHHFPVSLVEPRVLRLEWNGILPGIDAALALLGRYFPVQDEVRLRAKPWNELTREEVDDRITDLAAKGKVLEAITLVKIHYGYNLTEARRFVEELTAPV